MMTGETKAVRARITGHVQGVGFRAWAMAEARSLDLKGWVRNEADGGVTALLVGLNAAVDEMVRRLHEGPALASVSTVEIEAADNADTPAVFRIDG